VSGAELRLAGSGAADDALRALCAAAWQDGVDAVKVAPDGVAAESAIAALSL
jgi:hypothetical protein